jgi:primary-amine oxidase
MRREPRVIEALARRGIADMERVLIDTWAYGAHLLPEEYSDRRLGWADVWHRAQPGSNPYANPISGLHLIVDLNRMELLEIEDDDSVPPPATMGEYVPRLVPGQRLRGDLKPLDVVQPQGG